jgi:UDP-glucose 4-epimerase
MPKKKVLVTGAMGFIGANWCKKLLDNNFIVYGVDLKKSSFKHKNFFYYRNTVFNHSLINKLIKKSDFVCHFAGIAEPLKYLTRTSEVIDLTIIPSINIVNQCSKLKKKLYFTSTSEVYGNLNKKKFNEKDDRLLGSTIYSRWCYSTAKALVEHYIIAKAKEKKLDYIIFRLFNVYGPNLKGRVVDNFIEKAINNQNLKINGNGKQTRCFLYIEDCMDAFYSIFSKKISREIFNIGEDKEINILNFAKKVVKLSKSKSKIVINSKQLKKFKGYQDIVKRVPDVTKLKKMTKWKPKFGLDDGLRLSIDKFKK